MQQVGCADLPTVQPRCQTLCGPTRAGKRSVTQDRDPILQANLDIGEVVLAQPRSVARRRTALLAMAGSVALHAILLVVVGWAAQRHNPPSALRQAVDRLPIQVSLLDAAMQSAPVADPEPVQSDPIEPQAIKLEAVTIDTLSSTETTNSESPPSIAESVSQREEGEVSAEQEETAETIEAGVGRRIVSGLPALIRGPIDSAASSQAQGRNAASAARLPGSDRVIVAGMPLRVQRSPAERTLAVITFFTGGSGHLDPCLMEERLLAYDDIDSVKALLELRRRCRGRD